LFKQWDAYSQNNVYLTSSQYFLKIKALKISKKRYDCLEKDAIKWRRPLSPLFQCIGYRRIFVHRIHTWNYK